MGEKIAIAKDIKASDFEWYAASSHGDDAYAITIGGCGTSLETGRIYAFKADVANTGACTLNINGLGAIAIKKGSADLETGDIQAGQIIVVVFDGTYFQLIQGSLTQIAQNINGIKTFLSAPKYGAQGVSLAPKFGGTGADGALNISSGTTTINLGGASYYILNYTTISITGTAKLTFSNPATTGCIIVIKCQGSCVISSTQPGIDASGMGGAGGAGGVGNQNGVDGTNGIGVFDDSSHKGLKGQAAGTGGTGGVVYLAGTINLYTRSAYQIIRLLRGVACGAGGGGGAGNSGGAAGSQTGGAGGAGGGAIIMEVAGSLNFTGTISVAGIAGGSAADIGLTNGNVFSAGGGGGGAGGFALVLYNSLTANSGTILCGGGAGGAGGDCNSNGAHGETGNSAAGGGGAGADGGAGGDGRNYNTGTNGGDGGGRRAGGGGSGGMTSQNQGLVPAGAGGAGGASENVLVVQNDFFT